MSYYDNTLENLEEVERSTRCLHLNQIYHRISEARISKVLKASSACGQIRPAFSNKGPRKIIQAKQVFERLQVDLVDLPRRPVTHDGSEFRYALVVLDIFSRYLFLRALKKKSSAEVSEYLELIFREHGTPKIIQTDQGTEFQGVFDDLCNRRNIRHIRSRPYHPESQGKVERINRSWKNKMFYDLIINENTNWVNNLTLYSETYNQSKHRGLGYLTPFYVYFGRDYTQSSVSNDAVNDEDADVRYFLEEIQAKEDAKKKANEKIQKYYEKQKVVYEGDACAVVYNVGDEVMVKLTGKKYDLTKKKNVIRPGVIVQARVDAFLYLIQYEYNNASREDWYFVDNITCRTVQEQEQRLAMSKNKCSNNSHPQTTRKRRRSSRLIVMFKEA
ncbi:unnamed protein product [Rotaria magnacalcarata]|uniref:Integrase catalytic domain-containing protein n=1 Tax=Rotaria magnacalcarata TaxID=392030 RepID=A0A820GL07_9BILA|nr:unnamed protein product [Rotaria magnacalcarata]